MPPTATSLDTLCINVIRGLAIDAVQRANSGHPGMPMGAAPMAYALWTRHLRHNPRNPKWFDRDRFILSAGHGSMLLYSLLHLTGYDLSLDDIKNFRQFGSRTPGHPENVLTPGVEMATGPLGQGISTAVGMAIAESHLAAAFNKSGHTVVDHFTYVICSDGDLMEGIAQEACSLAGHLRLSKLIALYDDNGITIDGKTDLAYTEDVTKKFEALGWEVLACDGMDVDAVDRCLIEAKKSDLPTLIRCRTTIGFGSPNRAGTSKSHGEPLGADEVRLTKEALGLPNDQEFWIDDEALAEFRQAVVRGEASEGEWAERLAAYAEEFPQDAARLTAAIHGVLGDFQSHLPALDEAIATRAASGKVVNAVAPHLVGFLGGGADLTGNVNVPQKDFGVFTAENRAGRTIHYGVREHAMMAAVNGITLHGAALGFGGTFLIFSDYCKPSIRLAALMECPSVFVFTHDSIGLGEDGPTHQPVEQLAGLRAIPNLNVIRPADANETVAAWKVALESKHTPTLLALSRQALPPISPTFNGSHPAETGGYVVTDFAGSGRQVVLIGTGSEVQLCVSARRALAARGVDARVVSLPSFFLFDRQSEEYRARVLPPGVPAVSIEAATTFGWAKYAQAHVGLDRFGASAPGDVAMRELGFTPEHVAEVTLGLLGAKH